MGAVKTAFLAELDKFNNQKYNALQYDADVILNEVDAPYTVHHGKNAVISYLNTIQQPLWPKLKVNPNTIDETISGTNGQVTGSDGSYQDSSTANSTPFRVRYVFNFRLTNGVWLVTSGSATRV
jgi:hypothetical protein